MIDVRFCKYRAKILQKKNFAWTVEKGDKAGSSSCKLMSYVDSTHVAAYSKVGWTIP